MDTLSRDEIIKSLQRYKQLRDALLHEDTSELEHHLNRIVRFCETDTFIQSILSPIIEASTLNSTEWWQTLAESRSQRTQSIDFPADVDDELVLRFLIMKDICEGNKSLWDFGIGIGTHKESPMKDRFLSLVARPFFEELSDRLGEAAKIASPEIRALQAVPYDRLPSSNEVKIFLSHKTIDKPLVYRFYKALRELGFQPWLDDPDMPAGRNLERSILRGFEESCAAVFFVTQSFVDEGYLATEVDYARLQARKKGDKFVIITLVFSDEYKIPGLLEPYTYKVVANELDGFYEIVRALPIELGPVRWKEYIVSG